jgi:hypothetical protein
MNNTLCREIAREYHFREIPMPGCNFISFQRDHANGYAKIHFYEDIQILYLAIVKRPYKTFRKTFPTHEATVVYDIFRCPNNQKK